MRYLLDTNIFIESHKRFYNMAVFPCFWAGLVTMAQNGIIFTIDKVKDEVYAGKDDIKTWFKNNFPANAVLPVDEVTMAAYQRVQTTVRNTGKYKSSALNGYAADTLADPFICAYALGHGNISIVSYEISKPSSQTEIKIPDVCNLIGIPCLQIYEMLLALHATFDGSVSGLKTSFIEPSLF